MTTELLPGGTRESAAEFVFTAEAFDMRSASLEEKRAVLSMFVRHTSIVRRIETAADVERVARQEHDTDFFVVRDDSTRQIIGFATGSADYDRELYEEEVIIPIPEKYRLGPIVMAPEFNDRSIRVILGTTRNVWAKESGHKRLTSK